MEATFNMYGTLVIGFAFVASSYVALLVLLHLTQGKTEPCLLESTLPFLDSALGIMRHRADYLAHMRWVMET